MHSLPHQAGATAAVCYALGWTQHSKGVQIISRPAGFCNCCWVTSAGPVGNFLALRGHASIQGSTDIPTLYDILPGVSVDAAERRRDASAVFR